MLLQEPLFLDYDSLFEYCDLPLESENPDKIMNAASFAVNTMLKKFEKTYKKLKLSVFEAVFSSKKSITDICRQKYPNVSGSQLKCLMCCVLISELNKGKKVFFFPIDEKEKKNFGSEYTILPPIQIKLPGNKGLSKKKSQSVNFFLSNILVKKRKEVSAKVGAAILKLSQKELAFVTRFNEETFFKNVAIKPFSNFALTEIKDISAFTALYAITFYGLSLRDIYMIDEVFSFSSSDIRVKDDVKHRAASELSHMAEIPDEHGKAETLSKMGETLLELPLPESDAKNLLVLAENHVLYSAVSDIGAAYLKAFDTVSPELRQKFRPETAERAQLLSDHKYLSELCEETAALIAAGKTSVTKTKSRKKAVSVSKRTYQLRESAISSHKNKQQGKQQ